MTRYYHIAGTPKPQSRPRAFFSEKGQVRIYDPPMSRKWKSSVAQQASTQQAAQNCLESKVGRNMDMFPADIPLNIQMHFYLPRPKTNKSAHHVKKPDIDNLIKAVKDALQGIVYENDSQIVSLEATKDYVRDVSQSEGVIIAVREENLHEPTP